MVTASADETARLWDTNLQNWLNFLHKSLPRRLSQAERQRFFLPEDETQIQSEQLISEAEQLAEDGQVEPAIAKFKQAIQIDNYWQDKLNPELKAQVLAMPNIFNKIDELAEQGNLQELTQQYQLLADWNVQLGVEPEVKAKQFIAQRSAEMTQGIQLAKSGAFEPAIIQFKKALKRYPELDFDPIDTAQTLAIPKILQRAQELAQAQLVETAIQQFQLLADWQVQFDTDPQTQAQQLAAQAGVEQAQTLIQQHDLDSALLSLYQAQQYDPKVTIPVETWNRICWQGHLFGQGFKVLDACTQVINRQAEDGRYLLARLFRDNIQVRF